MTMKLCFALTSFLALAGCAAIGPETTNTKEEPSFVTGSNLPQRGARKVQTVSPDQIEDMRRGSTIQLPVH